MSHTISPVTGECGQILTETFIHKQPPPLHVVEELLRSQGIPLLEGPLCWRETTLFSVSRGISSFLFEVVDDDRCLITDTYKGHMSPPSHGYVRIERCEGTPQSDTISVGEPLSIVGISRKTKKHDPAQRYNIPILERIVYIK